ncbi:MAG: TolC family protein [Mucispirillum sp.]|uniref:TolC family protein n=1 Tax=Candidatus Mucispirillum faecigallinarum TaxID=2838699 RepID=A0A9D2GUU0_9BACT|nr:TolC family protein [Mucispirillum sp.]HIZ89110.1 TolC family protein [Candidatus Mucispirillum faecigallinarum]
MNKIILTLTFSFIFVTNAFAQISLDECYILAKNNYPQIKKADLITKTKDYSITNANMGYVPKIIFSARASYQSDVTKIPFDVPFFDIPVLSNDQYKITVDVVQPIWDGGKIEAEKDNIEAQSKSEESSLEVQLYNLKYRVNQLFFSILLLDEQLKQNEIYSKDLERTYNMVKQSIRNGVANTTDLDTVTLEQIKNKQAKAQIKAVKETYSNALSILIGKNIDNGLIKPEYVEINDYTIKRPELEFFADKINLLEVNKKNITASYMPKFDLFFSAGYGKPGLDMLDDSFQPYYIAGIKMDWAIVGFYTGERNKKIIELNKKSLELEKQTFLFNTNIDIQNQQSKIKQIKDTMAYDDEIVQLRNNIRISSEIKMKQGTMTVNDYMREVTAENIAKQGKILHEIELLQAVYEMKNIINQ